MSRTTPMCQFYLLKIGIYLKLIIMQSMNNGQIISLHFVYLTLVRFYHTDYYCQSKQAFKLICDKLLKPIYWDNFLLYLTYIFSYSSFELSCYYYAKYGCLAVPVRPWLFLKAVALKFSEGASGESVRKPVSNAGLIIKRSDPRLLGDYTIDCVQALMWREEKVAISFITFCWIYGTLLRIYR